MLNTLSQPLSAIWLLLLGLGGGAVFGMLAIFSKLFRHYIFRLIFDIIGCVACGILFIYGVTVFNSGEIRVFLIGSFLLGICIERKTVGILFAKLFDSVYNSVAKFMRREPKTKLGKILFK